MSLAVFSFYRFINATAKLIRTSYARCVFFVSLDFKFAPLPYFIITISSGVKVTNICKLNMLKPCISFYTFRIDLSKILDLNLYSSR